MQDIRRTLWISFTARLYSRLIPAGLRASINIIESDPVIDTIIKTTLPVAIACLPDQLKHTHTHTHRKGIIVGLEAQKIL